MTLDDRTVLFKAVHVVIKVLPLKDCFTFINTNVTHFFFYRQLPEKTESGLGLNSCHPLMPGVPQEVPCGGIMGECI